MITEYDGKSGQEGLFLGAISGISTGYIVWKGEDGEFWGEIYGKEQVSRVDYRGIKPSQPDVIAVEVSETEEPTTPLLLPSL